MSATHHLNIRVAMILAITAAVGAPAVADTLSVDLARDVQRAVNRYAYFTVFDDVSATFDEDGIVTLTGNVTLSKKKTDLARRVEAIDGVNAVRNEINVLPTSRFDNELRYRVARAIYGSSAFWHYAARLHPPIHIVVDRGHVTLTGVADTKPDIMLAGVLAAQFGAFSVTNELQLPGDLADELDQEVS